LSSLSSKDNYSKPHKPNWNKWGVIVLLTLLVILALVCFKEKYGLHYLLSSYGENPWHYESPGLALNIATAIPWGVIFVSLPLSTIIFFRKDIESNIILKLFGAYFFRVLLSIFVSNVPMFILGFR
jgi:hypothetical protein